MQEVVIFGATGFIGRNLVGYLHHKYRITAVSRNGGKVLGAAKSIRFDRLDGYKAPEDAVVVNLAASRYNAGNLSNSDILFHNVDIAGRVFQFCLRCGIKELRLFSSISVYPADDIYCDDDVLLDLISPPHKGEFMYAWAKRIAEIYSDLFKIEYDINTITFRPTSPYGPFDSLDVNKAHVVPALIMRALSDPGPLVVKGNPDATRDFIFVGDICQVVEDSLELRGVKQTYNLGSGRNATIRELAQAIIDCIDPNQGLEFLGGTFNPVMSRGCSVAKLERDLIHQEELTPLNVGLKKTIEWYKASL